MFDPRVRTSTVPAVEVEQYREALGRLPSGVTIVTAVDEDGEARGATVSAFMSLSLRPPMILVSLDAGSGTLHAIERYGQFAVHILGAAHTELAMKFASNGADKFSVTPHVRGATGVPLLDEYESRLECHLHSLVAAGDHTLVIGAVDVIEVADSKVSVPMVWFRGGFRHIRPD